MNLGSGLRATILSIIGFGIEGGTHLVDATLDKVRVRHAVGRGELPIWSQGKNAELGLGFRV